MSHISIRSCLFVLASCFGAATPGLAETWAVKSEQSPVTFLATGKPGFLKIKGEGGSVAGSAAIEQGKLTGTFDVALAPLKTGIDLRDEHMHGKYLESAKFPTARLVLDPVAIGPAKGGAYEFTGKFTLKGVEKPVSGKLVLKLEGNQAKGQASFELALGDYPVGVPSHLGITVAESVKIEADVTAERRLDVAQKP